jgi:competence protein ComEA
VREDDVVAARLRSVLAATDHAVRDRAATADLRRAASTGHASRLGDLAEPGGPLRWSDVVPAWPDDVDLDPLPVRPVADGVTALPAAADPETTGGFRAGTPWATPPGMRAGPLDDPADPFPTHLGDLMSEAEPFRAPGIRPQDDAFPAPGPQSSAADAGLQASAPSALRLLGPRSSAEDDASTAGLGPSADDGDSFGAAGGWPASAGDGDEFPQPTDVGSPVAGGGLTGAGAFAGGRLAALDPGRRGVRALAVVAVVVIVVAALLAWRARPRVDPVEPPAFGTSAPQAGDPVRRAVTSSSAAEVVVAVGGKVRKPGLVHLPAGARVADALAAAGGADPGVDVEMLNLARKVVDGELIMVGVTPPPGAAPAAGAPGPAGGLVNLNTATLADLDGLPGVGPVLAQRILDAREAQGGFAAVSDLRKVDGIGDARYEQLKDLVTV